MDELRMTFRFFASVLVRRAQKVTPRRLSAQMQQLGDVGQECLLPCERPDVLAVILLFHTAFSCCFFNGSFTLKVQESHMQVNALLERNSLALLLYPVYC